MIQLDTIRLIDDKSDEGKLLIAAIAILTSINEEDIKDNTWGSLVSPDKGLRQVQDLANKIYYKEEWEAQKLKEERETKIKNILNGNC